MALFYILNQSTKTFNLRMQMSNPLHLFYFYSKWLNLKACLIFISRSSLFSITDLYFLFYFITYRPTCTLNKILSVKSMGDIFNYLSVPLKLKCVVSAALASPNEIAKIVFKHVSPSSLPTVIKQIVLYQKSHHRLNQCCYG